jgi:hypothetical protein
MKPDDDQLLAHVRSDVQILIQRRDSLKAMIRNYNRLIDQNMKVIEQIQERKQLCLDI